MAAVSAEGGRSWQTSICPPSEAFSTRNSPIPVTLHWSAGYDSSQGYHLPFNQKSNKPTAHEQTTTQSKKHINKYVL